MIELKRTDDGGHMELQALRYAAMVSTMTFRQAVEAYRDSSRARARIPTPRKGFLSFSHGTRSTRSASPQTFDFCLSPINFSRELTIAVM